VSRKFPRDFLEVLGQRNSQFGGRLTPTSSWANKWEEKYPNIKNKIRIRKGTCRGSLQVDFEILIVKNVAEESSWSQKTPSARSNPFLLSTESQIPGGSRKKSSLEEVLQKSKTQILSEIINSRCICRWISRFSSSRTSQKRVPDHKKTPSARSNPFLLSTESQIPGGSRKKSSMEEVLQKSKTQILSEIVNSRCTCRGILRLSSSRASEHGFFELNIVDMNFCKIQSFSSKYRESDSGRI
jgi:hypothetical protein